MSFLNLISSELPLARNIFLAWLTATLLHVKWGTTITLADVSPIEFAIQAGMLFGYFIAWALIVSVSIGIPALILSIPLTILVGGFGRFIYYLFWNIVTKDKNEILAILWHSFAESSTKTRKAFESATESVGRGMQVVSMFLAFIFYSEPLLNLLAPVGLVFTFVVYVLVGFDVERKSATPNKSENP